MPETLYEPLQRAAFAHGDRPALEFRGRRLSWAELQEASDRVAALLAELEIGAGRRVAFSFRKGPEALIALYGVIRSGATYVPLDPSWPAARIRSICEDAAIDAWVGDYGPPSALALSVALARDPQGTNAIPLSRAGECRALRSAPVPPASGVANVLYTSGSTGRPKGVQITTRSLLHFSQWVVETFGLTAEDRVANHAPYHFDLSTLDIFAAVRAGATMLPLPESSRALPYQAVRFVVDRAVTVWYSVPSALVLMRPKLAGQDVRRLRHVIFAGEVMPKGELQALARELPRASFANLYGPTETNVCTYHRVEAQDLRDDGPLPIGRPIDATRVWILDDDGRPSGGDGPGELLVAGPTVSPGYLGDPALTARRMVPAPDGEGVAYRTGDRVSRRSDGVLQFHGRLDRMIKCRGYRIEPGEIESVLGRHPQVREAAVVPVREGAIDGGIRAYVVGRSGAGAPPSVAELEALCREHLPLHMLPDEWRFCESLARNERGKIDYRALGD